jgi:SAM-dependent methyltransferase
MPPTPTATATPGDSDLVRGYNDVAYSSFADSARHPERLATIGTLLGLDAAPLPTCRVLEFACGNGLNLVPMAATWPGATFVGFDLAARPVATARRMASELGLANVQFLELDLRELPAELGTFDYIIAHGLYSWVPADVRAQVLPLIARHLAPQGVAFVSYNTLPGCHLRRAVWDMVKYHTRELHEKSAKVASARALLDAVGRPVAADTTAQQALRAEMRDAGAGTDSSLAHDDLGEPNDPVYFHEFMADASRSGLAFLAEARVSTMMGGGLAPEVRQALAPLERLVREQYLDFVNVRRYRETLLCHEGALSRFVMQPPRAQPMHVLPSRDLRLEMEGGVGEAEPESDVAALKRLLVARWPRSIPVSELVAWHAQRPSATGTPPRPIESLLVEMFVAGIVDLRTSPVPVVAVAGERPVAFAPARWMLGETEYATSVYHDSFRLGPDDRRLVMLLDGRHTRADLVAALGNLVAGPPGGNRLDAALAAVARLALLVG